MTRAKLWSASLALLVGCIPPYEPPTAAQPHGIVKLRRSYDRVAGRALREAVNIDQHSAFAQVTQAAVASTPRTDSILVHPVRGLFQVASNFFHQEMRVVSEPYTAYESRLQSEAYDCSSGFGTSRSYRTCTRMVSRQEPVTKYRTVNKLVEVSDGACSRQFEFTPLDQHVYLVQYTYRASGVCELGCYEQVAGPNDTFVNKPCPP